MAEQAIYDQGVSNEALIWRVGGELSDHIAIIAEPSGLQSVAILVGPGNNGADGLVAAVNLAEKGFHVHVYFCTDKDRQNADLIRRVRISGGVTDLAKEVPRHFQEDIAQFDIVVDAILGISKPRKVEGVLAEVLHHVREALYSSKNSVVIAVDVPSGMDADTGEVDDLTIPANYTLAVGYPKRGFFLSPGCNYVGVIQAVDIGLYSEPLQALLTNMTSVEDFGKDRESFRLAVDSHKGSKGHVLAIVGSAQYPGAAILTGMAAYRSGCGLVTLMSPDSIFPVIGAGLPEAIHLTYPDLISDEATFQATELVSNLDLNKYDSIVLGCGLSNGHLPSVFVNAVLDYVGKSGDSVPMVVDAGALNCLADSGSWWEKLDRSLVLTPHAGEMSRLVKSSVEYVQQNRLEVASAIATKVNQITVLKGAFTVVADVDGSIYVNPHANPVLGTAGSGDVLSGLIASLLAQGLPELLAVKLAVYVHGQAGQELRLRVGDRGVIATDIVNDLPKVLNELVM